MHLPLPVLALAQDLINSGFAVEIIDERLKPDYKESFKNQLAEVTLFGVSAMTGYQIKGGLEASAWIKEEYPDIPVVWGGWHSSMLPEETLKNNYIDAAVVGPGEGLLPEIAQGNKKGVLFGDTTLIGSISREALELVDMEQYIHDSELGKRSIFWVTSKGCPYTCGFCCSQKIYQRRWQAQSVEKVLTDISHLQREYDIDGINFVDTNFFIDKERIQKLAEGLIRENIRIKWAASVRADQINMLDNDFLELLSESGCIKVFIGAESGSVEVLELIDKKIKIEDVYQMADLLDKHNIVAEIFIMAGFPINPEVDLKDTLNLVKGVKEKYPNHQFTSFIYTPYPGTELYNMAQKHGLKPPADLAGWINWDMLQVRTPWIKKKNYADRLHRYVKMFYPLAFPSQELRRKFKTGPRGWVYYLLHKLESFRVKQGLYGFPIEWQLAKFFSILRSKYRFLGGIGSFR